MAQLTRDESDSRERPGRRIACTKMHENARFRQSAHESARKRTIGAIASGGYNTSRMKTISNVIVFLLIAALSPRADAQTQTLMQARQGFTTKLVPSNYESDGPADEPPAGNPYVKIKYPSKAGKLIAYLTPDPKHGKKRPAIVWAHGGFGGIGEYYWSPQPAENDQTPKAFLDAGFVVMLPSWRGENENPGKFELFYGEVDDALAAIDYAAKLPYVDTNRIYFGGHSTGGTITLLSALCTNKVRAAFSFGGAPDMAKVIAAGGYGNTPFDTNAPKEAGLRSAVNFIDTLKTPTWYFEGSIAFGGEDALQMQQHADAAKAPLKTIIIEGANHFDILRPLTALIAAKAAADTGPKCNISITDAEVATVYDKSREAARAKLAKLPMITLTPVAGKRVLAMMQAQQRDPAKTYLRIHATKGPEFVDKIDLAVDEVAETQGVKVVMDKKTSRDHRGLSMDFDPNSGFKLLPPEGD